MTPTTDTPAAQTPLQLVILINGNYVTQYVDQASADAFAKLMDGNPYSNELMTYRNAGICLRFRPCKVDGWYVASRPPGPPTSERLLQMVQEQTAILKKGTDSGESWREQS